MRNYHGTGSALPTMDSGQLYYICKYKNMLVRNGLFFFCLFIFSSLGLHAQDSTNNSAPKISKSVLQHDTAIRRSAPPKKRPAADTGRAAVKPRTDSHAVSTTVVPKPAVAAPKPAPAATQPVTASKQMAAAPRIADTSKAAGTDTLLQRPKIPLHQETAFDVFMRKLATTNMYLRPNKPHYFDLNVVRPYKNYDWLVYLVGGVVALLGIIRLAYLKYFSDLFRAFLNPTLSQRQLKDQLSQSPFPNFLLNAFFSISLGVYLYLLMYRQQYIFNADAWLLIPGLVLLVALIYGVKHIVLRFCGWLFGNNDLADAYIFILNLINKVLGILLVPFLVILAFCQPEIARAFLYISLFFIVLMVGYRYVRAYSVVKQYLSFSRLHFFLYLCAFEVAPVLLLTKVLLIWLTGN
ncbi:MAG TPA: DUF4271 domain-containing protein [Chitinophaga sp.]|uniref:DUF4271 domain-containing protein n=1 Tax=Chitinophaga sp. TaxID=1869181 RepID=UPI002DB989E1|nr:DUF4271 domain-containing protein [Chitinophaga sp.]HEU4551395.1 DUF4271 domain-containing protein [Chitinophaga sp.]